MLDKRLKRMEERVIKLIPKDDMSEPTSIPRAVIRPPSTVPSGAGKKRGAEEAFGPQVDEWSEPKTTSPPSRSNEGTEVTEVKVNDEGRDLLPKKEIQEHLSEIFFDNLYGQSYHLLHKPSYMKKLK